MISYVRVARQDALSVGQTQNIAGDSITALIYCSECAFILLPVFFRYFTFMRKWSNFHNNIR